MITIKDKVNASKPIRVGNVVEITNVKEGYEDTIPLKAIVIFDTINNNYKLLNPYNFEIVPESNYTSLQSLIIAYGLVCYSDNITITMK